MSILLGEIDCLGFDSIQDLIQFLTRRPVPSHEACRRTIERTASVWALKSGRRLSRDDLIQILTEPRNALTKQFQRFFQFDGIELVFSDDALSSVADRALERETGARGLRSIIEETLLDVQFELPSRRDVKKCVVTKETVEKGLPPTLVTEAAADADDGRREAESA